MHSQPMFYVVFENQPLLFHSPHEIITAHQIEEVLPAIQQIEQRVTEGWYAAGYLSYEDAPAFDSAQCVHQHSQIPYYGLGFLVIPNKIARSSGGGLYLISLVSEEQYQDAIRLKANFPTFKLMMSHIFSDLLRNDLSRISHPRSVKVSQSLTLGPYPTF